MISDMARTVDRIVTASKLPLSIVIVGVGAADFSNMVSTLFCPVNHSPLDVWYTRARTRARAHTHTHTHTLSEST